MTAARFDELIHPSTRLSLVGLLAAADWAEFAFLRDQLALSYSALSKQLSTLEDAGYVVIDRPLRDHRRRRDRVQRSRRGTPGDRRKRRRRTGTPQQRLNARQLSHLGESRRLRFATLGR